jgi:hypothetical protein
MERLAALEAEVKAEALAQRAQEAAARARLRDQRVTQHVTQHVTKTAEHEPRRAQKAELAGKKRGAASQAAGGPAERAGHRDRVARDDHDTGHLEDLGGALELASKANRVKQELSRKPKKGEKSWITSGVASLALGPIGWLYAGSLREAVPATAGWLALAALAAKLLPVFLMMPVLMVALPLSGIAGVVYALQYNRSGSRQRLFHGDRETPKQLRSG